MPEPRLPDHQETAQGRPGCRAHNWALRPDGELRPHLCIENDCSFDADLLLPQPDAAPAGRPPATSASTRPGRTTVWKLMTGTRLDLCWLYNLMRRGIEYDLVPWCSRRNVAIMAYSPIEQGRVLQHRELQRIAKRRDAVPAQVALAWVLRQKGVVAIPKAGTQAHVRENRAALELRLSAQDLDELDRAFPPPKGPVPLEML